MEGKQEKIRFMIFIFLVIMVLIAMFSGSIYADNIIKSSSQSNSDTLAIENLKEAVLTLIVNEALGLLGIALGGFGMLKRHLFSIVFENEWYSVISFFLLLFLSLYSVYYTISPIIKYHDLMMQAIRQIFYMSP